LIRSIRPCPVVFILFSLWLGLSTGAAPRHAAAGGYEFVSRPWAASAEVMVDALGWRHLRFKGGLHLEALVPTEGASGDKVDAFTEISALHARTDDQGAAMVDLFSDENRFWVAARLELDDNGHLKGLVHDSHGRLNGARGTPGEIEAVAATPQGLMVAFDEADSIWRYADRKAVPTLWGRLSGFAPLSNEGVEAVTHVPGRGLLCVAEKQSAGRVFVGPQALGNTAPEDVRPAWLLRSSGELERLGYHAAAGYRPTAAATLADGDVVIMGNCWRDCGRVNRIRLERIAAADLQPGRLVRGRLLAHLRSVDEKRPVLDNFEGLAAFRLDGREYLLLVSDDNGSRRQRTLLLLFELVGSN